MFSLWSMRKCVYDVTIMINIDDFALRALTWILLWRWFYPFHNRWMTNTNANHAILSVSIRLSQVVFPNHNDGYRKMSLTETQQSCNGLFVFLPNKLLDSRDADNLRPNDLIRH